MSCHHSPFQDFLHALGWEFQMMNSGFTKSVLFTQYLYLPYVIAHDRNTTNEAIQRHQGEIPWGVAVV